jgi:O-antigen/teichoic acid export membrane protein
LDAHAGRCAAACHGRKQSDHAVASRSVERVTHSPRNPIRASAHFVGARLSVNAISWLGTLIVVRALTQSDWGEYTLVITLTVIIDALVNFQLSRHVTVELIERPDSGETMSSFLTLRICLATLGYGVAVAIAALGPYPPSLIPAAAIGCLNLLFGAALDGLVMFQQVHFDLGRVASVLIGSRIVFVALVTTLYVAGSANLLLYVLATLSATALPFVALLFHLRRSISLRPVVDLPRWRRWITDCVPIALAFALGTLYFRIDALLLSFLDDVHAVGLYGVGYKFADVLGTASNALLGTVFVLFVRSWPTRATAFWRNWRGAFMICTVLAAGSASGFAVFARPAVATLFGSDYEQAAGAARVVVVGAALNFLTALLVITLVAVGRTRVYIEAALIGLILNIAINLAVIPRYSYDGAAWVTLVTEVVVFAALLRGVARVPAFPRPPWRALAATLGAATALVGVGVATQLIVPWPVAAALAAAAFVGMLHILDVGGPGGLRVLPTLLTDEDLPAMVAPVSPPGLPS